MFFKFFNFFSKKKEIVKMDKKLLCALVIGHKKSSPGAYNDYYDLYEYHFNEELTIDIELELSNSPDVDIQKIYRRTYTQLPHDINDLNPDFIISLHCNAFNKQAKGCEVLYYHRSNTGKQLASILQKNLIQIIPNNKHNRGIMPITSEDRGGYLLKNTNAPCLIAEPFFIDNTSELKIILQDRYPIIKAYSKAIQEIANFLKKERQNG
jgi:N-acetylmuramoyl-L-alanine amidase